MLGCHVSGEISEGPCAAWANAVSYSAFHLCENALKSISRLPEVLRFCPGIHGSALVILLITLRCGQLGLKFLNLLLVLAGPPSLGIATVGAPELLFEPSEVARFINPFRG